MGWMGVSQGGFVRLSFATLLLCATFSPAMAEFDLLAPCGIPIGMKGTDLDFGLRESGFKDLSGVYVAARGAGSHRIRYTTTRHISTFPDDPVNFIDYARDRVDVQAAPADVVRRMDRVSGIKGECAFVNERAADCTWRLPPAAPLVSHVMLRYSRDQLLTLNLNGVADLRARINASQGQPPRGTAVDVACDGKLALGEKVHEFGDLTSWKGQQDKLARSSFMP